MTSRLPPRTLRTVATMIIVAVLAVSCADDDASNGVADPGATDGAVDDTAPGPSTADPSTADPSPADPSTAAETPDPASTIWPSTPIAGEVARWTVEVIERIDHDPSAFTQGLEVVDGVGYESTGRRGESTVRRFDPHTGEVTLSVPLDDALFAEGLTLLGDRLVQVTFTSGTGIVRDPDDLSVSETFAFEGEGWGVCAPDADSFWLSDGSTTLRSIDGDGFDVIDTIEVSGEGITVGQLNELECVDGLVLANMWHRDEIAVIDPVDGEVVALIDASPLAEEVASAVAGDDQNVLNGIAVLDDGTLLLTGKRWPTLFRVRLLAG